MKRAFSERLTTNCPRQGHDALDPTILSADPPADLMVERIGDLIEDDRPWGGQR
jgi:hypothetical protein